MENPKNRIVIYTKDEDEKYDIKEFAAKKHKSVTELVLELVRKEMDRDYWSKEQSPTGAGQPA